MNEQRIVTAKVTGELRDRLIAHAEARGVTLSAVVRSFIERGLSEAEQLPTK